MVLIFLSLVWLASQCIEVKIAEVKRYTLVKSSEGLYAAISEINQRT